MGGARVRAAPGSLLGQRELVARLQPTSDMKTAASLLCAVVGFSLPACQAGDTGGEDADPGLVITDPDPDPATGLRATTTIDDDEVTITSRAETGRAYPEENDDLLAPIGPRSIRVVSIRGADGTSYAEWRVDIED